MKLGTLKELIEIEFDRCDTISHFKKEVFRLIDIHGLDSSIKPNSMKIADQWIVGYKHLVKLEDGTYRIGETSNIYGYEMIAENKALALIDKNQTLS